MEQLVPFLLLGDGGVVAFWYHAATPAIVHIGSEGELTVVAQDFEEFLKAVVARRSGVTELDEVQAVFRIAGVTGMPDTSTLREVQAEFDNWLAKYTSMLKPTNTAAAESLRQRVYTVAEAMIRDGCSKVYTLSSPWWSISFKIESDGGMTYLDYGKWYPVPAKYKLSSLVNELLELVKHRGRKRYELSIYSTGIVSMDKDRELVLAPPKSG